MKTKRKLDFHWIQGYIKNSIESKLKDRIKSKPNLKTKSLEDKNQKTKLKSRVFSERDFKINKKWQKQRYFHNLTAIESWNHESSAEWDNN